MDKLNKLPLVSVVMPAYNGARFIEAAIRSVMAQTMPEWELLVLDDGSADNTCAIAEGLAAEDARIRLLPNEENMGVARTRNRGISLCRGRYVAFLDCDDCWLPHKLELQLERMRQTGAGLCYCSYGIMDQHGERSRRDYLVPETVDLKGLLRENVIGCSTVVLDLERLGDVRFRTDFYHEDYVLWLTLLQEDCLAAGCPEVLARWRLVENSRSFNKIHAAKSRWNIFRKCMGMSVGESLAAMVPYMLAGLRKYSRKES